MQICFLHMVLKRNDNIILSYFKNEWMQLYWISRSLWQFKRDEQRIDNNGASINLTAKNSSSCKYKSNLIGNATADEVNRKKENVKIVVPLKH